MTLDKDRTSLVHVSRSHGCPSSLMLHTKMNKSMNELPYQPGGAIPSPLVADLLLDHRVRELLLAALRQ